MIYGKTFIPMQLQINNFIEEDYNTLTSIINEPIVLTEGIGDIIWGIISKVFNAIASILKFLINIPIKIVEFFKKTFSKEKEKKAIEKAEKVKAKKEIVYDNPVVDYMKAAKLIYPDMTILDKLSYELNIEKIVKGNIDIEKFDQVQFTPEAKKYIPDKFNDVDGLKEFINSDKILEDFTKENMTMEDVISFLKENNIEKSFDSFIKNTKELYRRFNDFNKKITEFGEKFKTFESSGISPEEKQKAIERIKTITTFCNTVIQVAHITESKIAKYQSEAIQQRVKLDNWLASKTPKEEEKEEAKEEENKDSENDKEKDKEKEYNDYTPDPSDPNFNKKFDENMKDPNGRLVFK